MSTDAFTPAVFPRFHGADAEADRERARRRGYADGHAEGFRAGAEKAALAAAADAAHREQSDAGARTALASALSALSAATDAMTARARELSAAGERQLCGHAIELAEAILAEALADREFAAVTALRRALAAAEEPAAEVRLNPDDLRTLTERDAVPPHLTVVSDDALASGDAVVRVGDGLVDARIGAALDRARQALAEGAS